MKEPVLINADTLKKIKDEVEIQQHIITPKNLGYDIWSVIITVNGRSQCFTSPKEIKYITELDYWCFVLFRKCLEHSIDLSLRDIPTTYNYLEGEL